MKKLTVSKEFFLLILLIFVHLIINFYFLRQDTSLLFNIWPHYLINDHLKKILEISFFPKYDLLLCMSYFFCQLFGTSILSLRLIPSISFVFLIITIYILVKSLYDDRKRALLASFLVSFTPSILLYSRFYNYHLLLIALIYAFMLLCFLFYQNKSISALLGLTLILYAGTHMFKDGSWDLLFLFYVSTPVLTILFYGWHKKFRAKILLILLFFLFFLIWKLYNYNHFLLSRYYFEGIQAFPYPEYLVDWFYFLSFYWITIVNEIFLVPFIFFIIFYLKLIFFPKIKKCSSALKPETFLGSLFITGWILSGLSKKQVFYILPIIPLCGIFTAIGIHSLSNHKKTLAIITVVFIQTIIFYECLSGKIDPYLSGKNYLSLVNSKVNPFAEYIVNSFGEYEKGYTPPCALMLGSLKENIYYQNGKLQTYRLLKKRISVFGLKKVQEEIKNFLKRNPPKPNPYFQKEIKNSSKRNPPKPNPYFQKEIKSSLKKNPPNLNSYSWIKELAMLEFLLETS